jgi:hypothetical protein
MKLATFVVTSFLSFQALANEGVKFKAIESISGELSLSLEVTASATKKGLILKKFLAKKKAIKVAKSSVSEAVLKLCRSSSFIEEDIQFSPETCEDNGESVSCRLEAELRCGEISEGNTISTQIDLGLLQPSSACIKILEGDYRIDNDIVNGCNRIKTKTQYQCVETLATYSSIKTLAIRACGVFSSDLSQQVFKNYNERGFESPTPSLVVLLGAVNTTQEATCINNKLVLNSLSVEDLEKSCILDSKLDLDKREFDALGFVTNPRTIQYRLRGIISK